MEVGAGASAVRTHPCVDEGSDEAWPLEESSELQPSVAAGGSRKVSQGFAHAAHLPRVEPGLGWGWAGVGVRAGVRAGVRDAVRVGAGLGLGSGLGSGWR